MRPDGPRKSIVGPDSGPEAPFPLKLGGQVIKGFGRGSKEVRIFVFERHQNAKRLVGNSDGKYPD